MSLIRRPGGNALNQLAHIGCGNLDNRPLAPCRHELAANVALDLRTLPLARQLVPDEIFRDGAERGGPLAGFRGLLALDLGARVFALPDQLDPIPGHLTGAGKAHGRIFPDRAARRVLGVREARNENERNGSFVGHPHPQAASVGIHHVIVLALRCGLQCLQGPVGKVSLRHCIPRLATPWQQNR